MRTAVSFAAALLGLTVACSHPPPRMPVTPSGPTPAEQLATADALVWAGCLDCLLEAYREYDALRTVPASAAAATQGVVRAAALIALRQRELGMVDDGYADRARTAAASLASVSEGSSTALDLLDAVPPRVGSPTEDAVVARRARLMAADRSGWVARARAHADEDLLSAVIWVWTSCSYSPREGRTVDALVAPLVQLRMAPIVTYEVAVCVGGGTQTLTDLATSDARFHEIDFWLALRAIGSQALDDAEERLTRAVTWHDAWPSALIYLADVEATSEEFPAALELYERALGFVPGYPQALVGRIRMLSYLGRHEDAIRRSTELLQTPYLPGDAYYWRAWNEDKLDRLDEAWADVEHAERLWRNSDVFKLAGLVAYKRHELEIAQLRFNTSLALNPDDCEARFYLASVQVDLAAWPSAADSFAVSAMCLDGTQSRLAAEVERLRRSDGRPDRIARQIARREAERATTLRLLAQSWFNGAVSNLHLDRQDDARRLAEKLVDDEQFGARAKEILSRLR